MNSKILLFALLFFSWLVCIESSSSGKSKNKVQIEKKKN